MNNPAPEGSQTFASGLDYKIQDGKVYYFNHDEWVKSCKGPEQVQRDIERDNKRKVK